MPPRTQSTTCPSLSAFHILHVFSMNAFQNLSLEDMPTTRSQRARGRGRGRGRGQGPGPGRGRGDNAGSRADLLPEVPVHGDPPLGHDSQGKASIPSNRRSSSGTTFIIDRVQRYESQRGAYFAFQLNGPVSVRIYTATEKSQNVECTCTEYRSRQEFCMHIYVCSKLRCPEYVLR